MSRRQQRLCLVILAWIWLLPRLSFADPFTDHYERALQLYNSREYRASLDEFRTAYKLRQLPKILINMGRCNHRLGHAREALTLYQRYLTIEQNPEPKLKSDLETYIRQTQAMIAAAEEQEPPPSPPPAAMDTPPPSAPKQSPAQDDPPPLAPAKTQPPLMDTPPPPDNRVAVMRQERASQRGNGAIYGGVASAVLGLGLAGLGGASLALDGRCVNSLDPCERLYTGRVAGTAELVTGGLLLGAGIGLIALGVTWRRKDQRQPTGQASVRDLVRPWLLPAQRSPLAMARLP